jgi:glycosyltransferase involved in cell wall biosynthesis
MWDQIFPRPLSAMGRGLETRLAPPFYRSGLTVTPSDSTRDALIDLGFSPDRVLAFPNGVDPRFSVGGTKTDQPSIVAVGRLAPVKRHDLVIEAAIAAKRRVPDLTLTVVGNGPMRQQLADQVARADAGGWITLAGRLTDQELIDTYRRSWIVVSGSIAEGWGLSLTEGAACGTPAVATDIAGHRSSVLAGRSGELVAGAALGDTVADVLLDARRLAELRQGALDWADRLTWDSSALGLTLALLSEVRRRRESKR